jgi:hypothetical protein
VTNTEMYSIEVQDTPMRLQRTLTPGVKLLGERLVQATDRAGTGSHAHEGLGHCPHLLSADPSDKHLCQSFCNMRFIAAVAFERLSMELTFTIVFAR